MIPKKYEYNDVDGVHWADADEGDEIIYEIDFNEIIEAEDEGQAVISAEWVIPLGLTASDDFIIKNTALVKIASYKRGTYRVLCRATITHYGRQEVNTLTRVLKVY